jgi:hypothetical protein
MSKCIDYLQIEISYGLSVLRFVLWTGQMNTNYAVLVIADKMVCGILGILIIKRSLNKGVLILLEEK